MSLNPLQELVGLVCPLSDLFHAMLQVRNNLLEPVIQVFIKNGPRYNLLNSAVLEMVEFIRKENIKYIITHLMEQFGPQLEACDYVNTFSALKLKYEQNQVSSLSPILPI